ncbi:hypothetical protein KXV89_005054, partial [Aspergillus fumigatus]
RQRRAAALAVAGLLLSPDCPTQSLSSPPGPAAESRFDGAFMATGRWTPEQSPWIGALFLLP